MRRLRWRCLSGVSELWKARPDALVLALSVGRNLDLRGRQLLRDLGHTKIESTVRYLGLNVEDPPVPAEGTEVSRCVEFLDLSVEGLLHV